MPSARLHRRPSDQDDPRMTGAMVAVELLQAIIENLPVGVAIFTPQHTLALHNTRFVALTGIPTEGVGPGTSVDAWLDKMQGSAEYAGHEGAGFLADLRAWNRKRPLTLRRRRSNGQVIDSAYHPLPDGGFAVTITDVSDLASGDDTIRRRVTGLAAVLEHVPHGICVYGPDRRVSLFNAAYTEVMAGAPVAIGASPSQPGRAPTSAASTAPQFECAGRRRRPRETCRER